MLFLYQILTGQITLVRKSGIFEVIMSQKVHLGYYVPAIFNFDQDIFFLLPFSTHLPFSTNNFREKNKSSFPEDSLQ